MSTCSPTWVDGALANVHPRADLIGLARKLRLVDARTTLRNTDLETFLGREGGIIRRHGKVSSVVSQPKRHDRLLEDRVWTLLHRMGFACLSGEGGAILTINPGADRQVTNQIDVLAVDDEVCVAIECKSSEQRARRANMQEELAKHTAVREPLNRAINPTRATKRSLALAFWTSNAIVSANDRERALQQNVVLLDEKDLSYYETLTQHVGEAARYQFLADLLPGKPIAGLNIRVPALRSKMGAHTCYTFSVTPDYLLKIAYVSHRARGKGSDVRTYQRMVSRARLRKIARYISEPDAAFPTNIVINLEPGKRGAGAEFARAKQEEENKTTTFGWLTLRPTYKSAWVIDGQHRLYAYAGHPRASTSSLSVLALEGLPGSVQQKLFVDINAEQKSVKRSLLQELYADLHRSSDDPAKRTQALISEAVQELDSDPDSSLSDRILLADSQRTDARCISLNAVFSALDKPGFYYGSIRDNTVVDPGPFWDKTDAAVVRRSILILNAWFAAIRAQVPGWWDLGASEGGGLAMNDGVTICLSVMRSVVEHLDRGRLRLARLTPKEVVDRIVPYADALGQYFASFSVEERLAFRALRGIQGQTTGMRHAQHYIQQRFPEFQPDGLVDFLDREKARTNDRASSTVIEIERVLNRTVIGVLKAQFGAGAEAWWYEGVPQTVRTPVTKRQEEDKNQAGSKEAYLDLIDYREIVVRNWPLFSSVLGYGKTGTKERKTEWIVRVNEIRKVAMHASRGATVAFEQLSELETYLAWLRGRVGADTEAGEADATAADILPEPE